MRMTDDGFDTRRRRRATRKFMRLAGLGCLIALVAPAFGQEGAPPENAPPIQVPADATVESLFVDFLHYARMGRFAAADAFAKALLAHPELDPVDVLNAANKDKKSVETLLMIIKNSSIGDSASAVLELIERGERQQRQEFQRIKDNIDRLGGDPQQEFIATRHLMESGEYAIPPMIQTLLDSSKSRLWPRVISALPKIGKEAVNPLVMALPVRNSDVRLNVIHALGEIGYPQAIPYLRRLMVAASAPTEVKDAAGRAVARIETITGRGFPGTAEEQFYRLAELYYDEDQTVRSDPRLDEANVWYWDDDAQALRRVVVLQRIFGPVMSMRTAQDAILLRNDYTEAIALWLAGNIRRESRLGMNVESGDPDETGDPDPTRPAVFPRALYFMQTAGPRFAHLVLERAVGDTDARVALGAIEALRVTAGEASLVGSEDVKQPLVQALRFPELLVRIRAALALGAALPKHPFADSQFVVPVLAAAVGQVGGEQVLVVHPDENDLNRIAGALRSGGRDVIAETSFYRALQRGRTEFQSLAALFLSTDIADPGVKAAIAEFRSEFTYAKTPVVLLIGARDSLAAKDLAKADPYIESVDASATAGLEAALERLRERGGQTQLDSDLAFALALEATETLRRIAVDGRTVYDFAVAEAALIGALSSSDERLQITAASVLALARTPTAQRAIGHVALDPGNSLTLRIAAFGSLAESAKNNGHALEDAQTAEFVRIAREEADLTIRTAASQALGAMNLATNRASEIIRSYPEG